MTGNSKVTSLLYYIINCSRKKFYYTGPMCFLLLCGKAIWQVSCSIIGQSLANSPLGLAPALQANIRQTKPKVCWRKTPCILISLPSGLKFKCWVHFFFFFCINIVTQQVANDSKFKSFIITTTGTSWKWLQEFFLHRQQDIRLKWPNDIYFGRKSKLGGVIVKSSFFRNRLTCNIG